MFKFPGIATNVTFIICLLIMLCFTVGREKLVRPNKKDTCYRNVEILLTVLAIANYISAIVFTAVGTTNDLLVYPWISSMIRPLMIIFRNVRVRDFAARYVQVMESSLPMVVFILMYVVYFTMVGERLFADTIEGANGFYNLQYAFTEMFILITTSNFPNVMLPSYNRSRLAALYFIIYLVVGLFLLMNLLLAIFYSSYQ